MAGWIHTDCQNVAYTRLEIVKLSIRLRLKILRERWKITMIISIIITAVQKC